MAKNRPNYPGSGMDGATKALTGGMGNIGCGTIATVGIMFLLIVLAFSSTARVETGHIGVVTMFGAATDKLFQPGLNFKIPFVEGVESLSIQTQKKEADAAAASATFRRSTPRSLSTTASTRLRCRKFTRQSGASTNR